MPEKLKNQKIACRYFTWRVYERPNGVYYADGRITKINQPELGRHSLGTLKTMPRHADGRIFHGPRGGNLKPDTVRNILIRDVITPLADRFPRTGDEPAFEDGRVHSFRHYFCSVCADNHVPE